MYKKDIVYLDSGATSLTPDCVVDEMDDYYKNNRTSINRGNYKLAQITQKKYSNARDTIANFLGAKSSEIIFTKSTTSSINLVSKTLEEKLVEGDEIIVTNLEHHSNFLPWLVLAQRKKLKLKIVKARDLKIVTSDVIQEITDRTKIIAIHHVSNVIGDVVDVREICKVACEKKIYTLIDGAQAAPHMKINLNEINCDFYTISAHKMLGPTGLGVLYIKENIQDKINPFEYGGDMVEASSVDYNSFTTKTGPSKFEAGTQSIAEVIGFSKAIDFLQEIGMKNIQNHEVSLKRYMRDEFNKVLDYVDVYNIENDSGILLFNIKNVAVHDAVSESMISDITFDQDNIIIRDGQHCNNLTMKHVLGIGSVLRASVYIYNDYKDIDRLILKIKEIYKVWN